MTQLRVLAVSFDTEIQPWELPQFRGAVARKVGYEHEWFHNHNAETGGLHQRYPLIQYKLETRQGRMRPMLLCLDQGVEEAHHFFSQPDWSLHIGDTRHAMRIARLDVRQYPLQLLNTDQHYRLHKWLAFNSENYEHWGTLNSLSDQYAFLERLLAAHIIAFAEGVDWQIEGRFRVRITRLHKQEWLLHKGVRKLAFTLDFSAPLLLPEFVGLGKGISMGMGVTRRQHQS